MKYVKKIISVLSAAALSCSMMACGGTTEPTHTHTYSDGYAYNDTYHYHETTCGHDVAPEERDGYAKHTLVNGECSVCDYVQPLTLNEFVTDHKSAAIDFIKNKIRPSVVGNKEVKAEYAYIVGNSNNELSEINIVWTYAVNETNRKVEWANVALADTIPFRNIANNKYTLNASALTVDCTDIFEFDAQRNYNKQNIATALYEKAELTADVKLYTEIDSGDGSYRSFYLLGQADNKIIVKRIDVLKGDGSDDTLLNNVNRPFTTISTANEYEINGTKVYESAYALENLGPEQAPDPIDPDNPDPEEKIENVQDLIAKYAITVKTALNDNYLYTMGRQCIGRAFKTEKVLDTQWYVNSGENISKIEVVFKYDVGNGFVSYRIGTIELSSPINVKSLTKDTIANVLAENSSDATYTQAYSCGYDDQMATERTELKNVLCDKFFGENESATRFIRDIGITHGYPYPKKSEWGVDKCGFSACFTIIEITENQVKEATVYICQDQGYTNQYWHDDAKMLELYKNNLRDGYYAVGYPGVDDKKSYTISGVKVENNDSHFAAD